MTSYPMSHVNMLQQTSDNSWTPAHRVMNTPISTIESCDHLPKPSLLAQMPQQRIYWLYFIKILVYDAYVEFL
jgi:hypothetical protein